MEPGSGKVTQGCFFPPFWLLQKRLHSFYLLKCLSIVELDPSQGILGHTLVFLALDLPVIQANYLVLPTLV